MKPSIDPSSTKTAAPVFVKAWNTFIRLPVIRGPPSTKSNIRARGRWLFKEQFGAPDRRTPVVGAGLIAAEKAWKECQNTCAATAHATLQLRFRMKVLLRQVASEGRKTAMTAEPDEEVPEVTDERLAAMLTESPLDKIFGALVNMQAEQFAVATIARRELDAPTATDKTAQAVIPCTASELFADRVAGEEHLIPAYTARKNMLAAAAMPPPRTWFPSTAAAGSSSDRGRGQDRRSSGRRPFGGKGGDRRNNNNNNNKYYPKNDDYKKDSRSSKRWDKSGRRK